MDELIDEYAAYRLLTLDHDPNSRRPTVEIAHEALLREWQRLRGWLDESRDDLRLRRQLARAAEEWRQAQQDPGCHDQDEGSGDDLGAPQLTAATHLEGLPKLPALLGGPLRVPLGSVRVGRVHRGAILLRRS